MSLTKEHVKYAIKHYKEISKKEFYTDEMAKNDRKRGFDYESALEYEGFFYHPRKK